MGAEVSERMCSSSVFFCFKCNIVNKSLSKCLSVTQCGALIHPPPLSSSSTHTNRFKISTPPGFSRCSAVSVVSSNFVFLRLGMICYWLMPVLTKCLKAGGSFQNFKKPPTFFDVHTYPEPLTVCVAQVGWLTRQFEPLTTHTLYSCWYYLMWQTCWHSNCSTALNKKKQNKDVCFQFGSFRCWVLTGCSLAFLASVCLCPVPLILSVYPYFHCL